MVRIFPSLGCHCFVLLPYHRCITQSTIFFWIFPKNTDCPSIVIYSTLAVGISISFYSFLYTTWSFAINTGKESVPLSCFPSDTVTYLSETTYSISAPASITVSCIRMQFFTFAPLATLTPRNKMLFSIFHRHLWNQKHFLLCFRNRSQQRQQV